MRLYKNRPKRILIPNAIYFITTITFDRYPYFQKSILANLFLEELKICKYLRGFSLYAFNILHDHVHLMIKPKERDNVSSVIKSLKQEFSRNANRVMGYESNLFKPPQSSNTPAGENTYSRLRWENYTHMYPRLPRKLHEHIKTINTFQSEWEQTPVEKKLTTPKFKWQRSFHDHIIRDHQDFVNHVNYTQYNHLKHGGEYGEVYAYSSLKHEKMIDAVLL